MSLFVLAAFTGGHVNAETYEYTGNNFSNVRAAYTTNMSISGSFTTSAPLPASVLELDISTLIPAPTWTFTDGVQTITSDEGVFHTGWKPLVSTDSTGNITRADIWVSDAPIASENNQENSYITTRGGGVGALDSGAINARCNNEPACTQYLFALDFAFLTGNVGTWSIAVPTFAVGGSISGLTGSITLKNNDGDDLTTSANGNFTFDTELEDASTYNVVIFSLPADQTCTVSEGSGTISGSDITDISVICVTRDVPGTLPSGAEGGISITTDDPGCTFTSVQFLSLASANLDPEPPDELTLIDGVVQFTVGSCLTGATVTFSVDYGSELPADATYWKASDPWFELDAVVNGSVIQFSITDGGVGDDDGEANGQIVDPGGASIAAIFVDGFEFE